MNTRENLHRRIATTALRRGLLSAEGLTGAMLELGREGSTHFPVDVWVSRGWLDRAQLAEVLSELGVDLSEAEENAATDPSVPTALGGDDTEVDPTSAFEDTAVRRDARFVHEETARLTEASSTESPDETDTSEEDRFDSVTQTLIHEPSSELPREESSVAELEELGDTASSAAMRLATRVFQQSNLAFEETALHTTGLTQPGSGHERYILGDELGAGGGGRVVRAFDRMLGRSVAMKILRADVQDDDESLARFIAEAQATGQLEHPNIVPIYDFGTLPTGKIFYTMREIRRHSLREVLTAVSKAEQEVEEEYTLVRLVSILRQVCQAVTYAHVRGVIHRDLKPDNIMLGDYGEVLVMDWGLARVFDRGVKTNLSGQEPEKGHTLGTPAYMPPEQARGELEDVDELSDVYSLGAILYEILTLAPPYDGEGPGEVMQNVVDGELVPPSERAPEGRAVPSELERICLRAMASEKSDRYGETGIFNDELDDWLEGLQRHEAERTVEAGFEAASRYKELAETIHDLDEEVKRLASQIEGWEPIERKRELWELQDQRKEAEVESARAFGEAVSRYTQALAYQPGNDDARHGLAELYWTRMREAMASQNAGDVIYFEAMVRRYDDGTYAELLESESAIQVDTNPGGSDVVVYPFEEVDRRLVVADAIHAGETPTQISSLDEGSYLLVVENEERCAVRQPLFCQRGEDQEIAIDLPRSEDVEEGFVYVPGGEFLSGGDPDAFDPRPQKRVDVDSFFCARFPVTFAEYLEWVNELQDSDPAEAEIRAPQTRGSDGALARLDDETGLWVPDEILIEGPARRLYPVGEGHEAKIPVVGIRAEDAEAYCRWRSERDGRAYRLPTEDEWEKAGRGVDGRIFPWGNRFDATFCKMRFSRPEMPQLEPVGVFVDDSSPYGIRDMGGGVQEWCAATVTEGVDRPIRGGAWNQDARAARLASRVRVLAVARSAGIGMRLVYDA